MLVPVVALLPGALNAVGAPMHAALRVSTYLPHGYCYLWNPPLLVTHLVSDLLIGISYVAISLSLAYLVYRARREMPFSAVFIAFGVFIVACGMTHFMEVWTLWHANYWTAAGVKVVTAIASVTTAIVMPFIIPRVMTTLHNARLAEAQRVELAVARESNLAKSQFMATMSHELRTPLNAIMGYVDLIDMEICGPVTTDQHEKLRRVSQSSAQLKQMIDDVLNFERSERGVERVVLERANLAEIMRNAVLVVEPQAIHKGLQLTVDVADTMIFETDPDKIRRIVINLLSNAIKYTNVGEVHLSVQMTDDGVWIEVRDTGIGIDPAHQLQIFEPFWQVDQRLTRKVGGAGLGLSIVQRTLRHLGGSIRVKSEPGDGSTFTVYVPCAGNREAQSAA